MKERRRDKFSSFVQREMAKFLADEVRADSAMLTVTRVEVHVSGAVADVYVSIYGGDEESIMRDLKRLERKATEFLKRRMASKRSPEIRFVFDESESLKRKIEALLS